RGDHRGAEAAALEATRHMVPQRRGWWMAARELALASGRLGDRNRLVELASELHNRRRSREASLEMVSALSTAAIGLYLVGEEEQADPLLDRIDEVAREAEVDDPAVVARVARARAVRASLTVDPARSLESFRRSLEAFVRLGDDRGVCSLRRELGCAYARLGDFHRSEAELRLAVELADSLGLDDVSVGTRRELSLALGQRGSLEEGCAVARAALERLGPEGNGRLRSACHEALARLLLEGGDADEARHHAAEAIEIAPDHGSRARALATAAEIALAGDRVAAGGRQAHEARLLLKRLGRLEEGEARIRWIYAEALAAEGRSKRAAQAIAEARARLMEQAQRIADTTWRQRFLEQVPEHARTVERAAEWTL
ncbi:MAG: hypothetical protein JRI23_30725, partial [Deltaproteobacteria bacterium]|nr:hypothetical protein [Deltaproteobacteria bacterium]MBW2536569.1 hypothetical protein [Deltaproteobacteria bacterium]